MHEIHERIFARKIGNLDLYESFTKPQDLGAGQTLEPKAEKFVITEVKEVSSEEWQDIINNFFKSRDWLKGKGGINRELQARKCLLIVENESQKAIAIDPQGYDYARYVAKYNF